MTTDVALFRVARARIAVTRVFILATPEAAATRRVVTTTALVHRHAARWRPSRISLVMRRHGNQDSSNGCQP